MDEFQAAKEFINRVVVDNENDKITIEYKLGAVF